MAAEVLFLRQRRDFTMGYGGWSSQSAGDYRLIKIVFVVAVTNLV